MDFSIVMCVYSGDKLSSFKRALESVTRKQHTTATEIIVIRNGEVGSEGEDYLNSLDSHNLRVLRLGTNVGLARALNIGIRESSTDWIARMDADDVSFPERFEQQCAFLQKHPTVDILGTAIQEFTETSDNSLEWKQKRILPSNHASLSKYARIQSPIHHPSVMMRKSALLKAGGYPEDCGRFEDYVLWERMLLAGFIFANLPDVLLGYRVDSGAYARRGGFSMFTDEIKLQKTFLADGFITHSQFVCNIITRGCYRLLPTNIKKPLYRLRTLLKNKS